MTRLLMAMKTDVMVQVRTNLYAIGIGAGALVAIMLAWLASPEQLYTYVPTLMLLVVGGSTLLYVAGMIIFEKDEGTLNANIVSPLRTSEYLWSKIITLTGLATLEAIVMIGGAMLLMSFADEITMPNAPVLLVGIIAMAVVYTLIGIVTVVRFDTITDYLIPMAGIAVVLELPFLYFLGWLKHPLLLLIPTSGPAMLMQGAYLQLAAWEWLYATGYMAALVIGLAIWAQRAFHTHIVMKVG